MVTLYDFIQTQNLKLELHTKQIAPCESTSEEVSLECSHRKISSTDSRVRLHYKQYIVSCKSTTEEVPFK